MSKIGHGVGRHTVTIFGGSAMWHFFFAVTREPARSLYRKK